MKLHLAQELNSGHNNHLPNENDQVSNAALAVVVHEALKQSAAAFFTGLAKCATAADIKTPKSWASLNDRIITYSEWPMYDVEVGFFLISIISCLFGSGSASVLLWNAFEPFVLYPPPPPIPHFLHF